MFQTYQISDGKFFDVLKEPNRYKKEIDFYEPQDRCDSVISLNDAVLYISDTIRGEKFWQYVHGVIDLGKENHQKGKPYDLTRFY